MTPNPPGGQGGCRGGAGHGGVQPVAAAGPVGAQLPGEHARLDAQACAQQPWDQRRREKERLQALTQGLHHVSAAACCHGNPAMSLNCYESQTPTNPNHYNPYKPRSQRFTYHRNENKPSHACIFLQLNCT